MEQPHSQASTHAFVACSVNRSCGAASFPGLPHTHKQTTAYPTHAKKKQKKKLRTSRGRPGYEASCRVEPGNEILEPGLKTVGLYRVYKLLYYNTKFTSHVENATCIHNTIILTSKPRNAQHNQTLDYGNSCRICPCSWLYSLSSPQLSDWLL